MDPLQQQQIAMPTVEVYSAIEEQLLSNVAKALVKNQGLMIEEDILAWQAEQLSMVGNLTQENIITISKKSGMAIDEVAKALEKAGYTALGAFEGTLAEAVQQGILLKPPNPNASVALQGILSTYQAQAVDVFNMVNTTMLNQSKQTYIDIVNQTTGKVLAGVQSPQQALKESVQRMADKGIPALIDKGGKHWTTEAYVNMVMRSTVNNVANEMQNQRMKEYGVDLIEISSHIGSRPGCSPYQGNVYSLSGSHKKYPPLSSTTYGEASGIFGVNCGHVRYPFIEGMSIKRNEPYDERENDKAYKESQVQRSLERKIRKTKREYNMMEKINSKEGMAEARNKVLKAREELEDFLKKTGRTRNRDREQLPINNPRISGKPTDLKKQNSKKTNSKKTNSNLMQRFVKVSDNWDY